MAVLKGATIAARYTQVLYLEPSPAANTANVRQDDGSGGQTILGLHLPATASQAVYLSVTGAIAGGRIALAVAGTDTNAGLDIDAKGSGTIRLGNTSTGEIEAARQLRVTGGGLIVDRTGAANAAITLDADNASQQSEVRFEEAGAFRYILYYSNASNWLALNTNDSDGAGADADVIRIPDGQTSVDGNTTFDINQFDYVCDSCGRHEGEIFACCGRVEWHDDVALMRAITRASLRTGGPTGALAQMERLGLMHRYDDGQVFVSMNRIPMFLMSGMVQMAERLANIERRLA